MIKNNMKKTNVYEAVKTKDGILIRKSKPNFHPSKCPFAKTNGVICCTYSEQGKNKEKQKCHIKKNFKLCPIWQNSNLNKTEKIEC